MTQRYIKTDYEGCSYITAGKVYEAQGFTEDWIIVNSNWGHDDLYRENSTSHHFHGIGRWQWCDKDGNSTEG